MSPISRQLQKNILQASLEPGLWGEVLDGLCSELDVSGAGLTIRRSRDEPFPAMFSTNIAPELMMRHYEVDISRNPIKRALEYSKPLVIRTDETIPTRSGEPLNKTDYYRYVFEPSKLRYAMGAVIRSVGQERVFLGLYRERFQNRFDPFTQARFADAIHLVEHSVSVARHLEFNNLKAGVAEKVVDGMDAGIIVTDPAASVLYANGKAESLLVSADGITVRGNRLGPSQNNRGVCLAEKIAAVARLFGSGKSRVNAPLVVRLLRNTGNDFINLMMLPIDRQQFALSFSAAAVLLVITTPPSRGSAAVGYWKSVYNLTTAEAGFLQELMNEGAVRAASESRGIAYQTGKHHLKNIFLKVGVDSQVALMRMLSSDLSAFLFNEKR